MAETKSKNILNTLQHWVLGRKLPIKKKYEVQVLNKKPGSELDSYQVERMWLGNKVPWSLTAPECSLCTALSVTWTVTEGGGSGHAWAGGVCAQVETVWDITL